MNTRKTLVDLIRHGEPVGGQRFRGITDDPLSEKGWKQVNDSTRNHAPWDIIYTSPLLRCFEFAKQLADTNQIPMETDKRLLEFGYGEWEGKTACDIIKDDPSVLFRFFNDPFTNSPPGSESLFEFQKRVQSVWSNILQTNAGKNVLVVCHDGVVSMIICSVLNIPLENVFRIHVLNGGITRIRIDNLDGTQLATLRFGN